MATINGTLIFLRNDTLTLVGQLDGNIGGAADQLDATTKDATAAAKIFVNGETSWQGQVSALYDASGTLVLDDVIDHQWTVKFGQVVTGTKFLTGFGYIKSWRWTGPKNAMSNISIEFQGTAALAMDTN
jgi:TP901-1 family phage major tail protein